MASFPLSLRRPDLVEIRGLINGEWIHPGDGESFPVYDPSNGRTIQNCPSFNIGDFRRAIDLAQAGFEDFSRSTTAKERGALLRRWNDLVLEHEEDLARILSLENGKTLTEATGEVRYAASFISWFAEEATRSYGDQIPSSYKNAMVITLKEPVGVCGIITPWNFPAAMITRKIAPAFATGCSVVIKPPRETPFTALALAKLALEAGIPPGTIHVLPTKVHKAAEELATNPKMKKLSFTGSTRVGKHLTQLAAGTMKKVSMELGGNAAFIVFEDADIDLAVEGALICKFRSSGQTCVCANRLLVHRDVADDFTEKLIQRVKAMRLGPGLDSKTTHGPLVNAGAVAKIKEHVEDAVSKGGVVKVGGKVPEGLDGGFFYEPTVISNATADMMVAYDETFGPLAPVFTFGDEDEAISMANDTEFGLAGYFFSANVGRVMRVAQRLQCGMIGVNTGLISAAESPFGGINESGVGREGSKYGLSEYQNIKTVTLGNLDK